MGTAQPIRNEKELEAFRLGNKKKCRVSIISSKKLKKDTVKKLKKAGLKKFTTN